MPQEQKHLVVAYHKDCIDGLASAWAVEQKYGQDPNVKIDYVGFGHHQLDRAEAEILARLKPGSEILFVDVAPRADFLKTLLSSQALSIEIIDHHKSAYEALKGLSAPNLKMNISPDHPSAAHMVWDTLNGTKPRPVFFDMIAKMDVQTDLTTWQEFSAAAFIDSKSIRTIEEAFKSFEEMAGKSFATLALEGSGLYLDQYNRITKLGDNVMYTQLDTPALKGKWIPVVNADVQNFGRAISQYLRELGQNTGANTAFAWYMQGNGKITMSIRSDGSPDASAIAKHLADQCGAQGGGHGTSAAIHFTSIGDFTEQIKLISAENMKNTAVPAPKPIPAHK